MSANKINFLNLIKGSALAFLVTFVTTTILTETFMTNSEIHTFHLENRWNIINVWAVLSLLFYKGFQNKLPVGPAFAIGLGIVFALTCLAMGFFQAVGGEVFEQAANILKKYWIMAFALACLGTLKLVEDLYKPSKK